MYSRTRRLALRSIPSNGQVPRVLDLFAGAGGFSLGFHWAGFHTAVAIDSNEAATDTLVGNFSHLGTTVLNENLFKFSPKQLDALLLRRGLNNSFDVIIGGPPCQGWSVLGRGKIRSLAKMRTEEVNDSRNDLYKKFLDYIKYFQPKVAVMENVPGMLSHPDQNVANDVVKHFEEAGYQVNWKKINASDLGVPQHRERLFFVGIRNNFNKTFEYPVLQNGDGQRRFPVVTVKDAINDLPKISHGSREWVLDYEQTEPISEFAKRMRLTANQNKIFDHVCRAHNDQDLQAFKFLKQGGWYRDLPDELKRYRKDIFEDRYKKLSWSKPSSCVTAHLSKDCYTHIHPVQNRTISVREAARLQAFPDCFFLSGSMSAKFQLIGNAVSPIVSEVIASEIMSQVLVSEKPRRNQRKESSRMEKSIDEAS